MHVNHIYRNSDETFIFHGNETTYFIMYTTWSEVKWNEEKCEKQHTQKIMWFPSEYKTNLKRIKRSHEPFAVKNKNNDPNYSWKWMPKLLRNEWWCWWYVGNMQYPTMKDNELWRHCFLDLKFICLLSSSYVWPIPGKYFLTKNTT